MASRKTYPKEFKEQAVRLLQKNGNKSQVARELGITSGMLARWEQQAMQDGHKAFPGKGKPQDEELYQLKKEVIRLKEENEILKKAMGIGSQPELDLGSASIALSKIPVYPPT